MEINTINDRIGLIIKHYGMNVNSFSKKIGLSNNVTIANIVGRNRNNPSYDVQRKILDTYPEINPSWLVLGKGEMIWDGSNIVNPDDTECEACKEKDKEINELKDKLINCLEKINEK